MSVFSDWEGVAGLVMGGVGLALGLLLRAGHARPWMNIYWQRDLPRFLRNAPLSCGLGGVTFLLWMLAISVGEQVSPVGAVYILAASTIPLGLFFYVSFRAPEWSKPRWLRERERRLAIRDYTLHHTG